MKHFRKAPQEFAPQDAPSTPVSFPSPLAPTVDLGRKRTKVTVAQADEPPAPEATNEQKGAAPCTTIAGAHSVTGSRQKNEDAYLLDQQRNLWAVSDGIGGAPFGEVISRVSCNYLPKAWDSTATMASEISERLTASISLIDQYVSELSDLLGHRGSGATLIIAHYDQARVSIASVGDTRAFLLREGNLEQIGASGRVSVLSNALDQALGYHMALSPNLASFVPQPGDVLVLCTDGVWSTQPTTKMVSSLLDGLSTPEQIALEGNPQHMAYRLAEGSDMSDNATAVVVLFDMLEEPTRDGFTLYTPSL